MALPPKPGQGVTVQVPEQTNDGTFKPGDLAFGAVLKPGVWPTIARKLHPCFSVALEIGEQTLGVRFARVGILAYVAREAGQSIQELRSGH